MCTVLFEPKVDFVFKSIFGSDKHPNILISFLNACIKSKTPIVDVQIKNSEITKDSMENSFSRLDILAKTNAGEIINIEMQRADEKNMIKRSLYYWSKAYTNEYAGKGRYSALPRTICINVIDFELLKEENYHNVYVLRNTENSNILTDVIEIHFIELPKMKKLDENDLLSIWTAFINDPNDEKVIELETSYSELHEAKIELARLSRDPKEAENYRQRQNAISDKSNALLEAEDKGFILGKEKGIEEGIEKGIEVGIEKGIEKGIEVGIEVGLEKGKKEALKETAKNLIQLGIPVEQIAAGTKLTEEEVLSLIEEQNTRD